MHPLHAIAIVLAFLGSPSAAQDPALSRAGWTVATDSEQTPDNAVGNAIDGNTATIWHTQYVGATPALPHFITITMGGQTNMVSGVTILPRQDAAANANGNIGNYEMHLSTDGTTFPTASVATGTFADTQTLKTVTFTAASAKAVRVRALTEAGNSGPWTSLAEINVLGTPGTGGGNVNLDRSSWYAVADSAEYPNFEGPGKVLDGNDDSLWHSAYTPTSDALPHTISVFFGGASNSVSGLVYKPRVGGGNGGIGKYEVRISTNGETFPTLTTVATGTFADTSTEKTVTFTAVTAKGIQLKGLTEAGNRGPWSAAAEIRVLGKAGAAASKTTVGAWGALIPLPLVPVAAALLPDGKVLTWSAFAVGEFGTNTGAPKTQTATYDPVSGTVSSATVTVTNHDMFCPGISMLGSGEIVVTGGSNAEKTSIYDVATNNWKPGPNMLKPRGYQASTLLSTGEIFTLGGSWSGGEGGKFGEVFDPIAGAWRGLPNVLPDFILTNDNVGVYRADNHGWFFGWLKGEVFHAGPSQAMNFFTTAGTGGRRAAGTRPGGDQMNGNAVMYASGKILCFGGSTNYDANRAVPPRSGVAKTAASIVTITAPATGNPTASSKVVGSMRFQRAFANAVVLPGGQVVVIGGMPFPTPFSDNDAILHAEIWDPVTEKFKVLAKMAAPRTYHSVAVLLRDGRVFSGGGGLCGGCDINHFDGQILTPPNLFLTSGALASQPTITISKVTAKNGDAFVVTANRALNSIAILRMGSSTHSVNTDQRRIELCGPASTACAAAAGNMYTVTIPAQPGIALPGNWMVFGVDTANVPSKSQVIKVGSASVGPLAAAKLANSTTLKVGKDMATSEPIAIEFAATPATPNSLTPLPLGETVRV